MSCPNVLRFCKLRVTQLDSLGNVAAGPNNSYVTANAVEMQVTPEIETGEERTNKNGCGATVGSSRDPDRLKRFGLGLELAKLEPGLKQIMLGVDVIEDGGEPVGINGVSQIDAAFEPSLVAVEAWMDAEVDDAPDPDGPYVYFVWPASYWNFGQNTLGTDYWHPDLQGFSRSNPLWGTGPYDDYGITFSVEHYAIVQIPEAPPDGACGYATVTPGS
jgi:hypothetical protein